MSGLVDLITFELPEHWSPAQALAVHEALETLSAALWAYYGAQMQALIAVIGPERCGECLQGLMHGQRLRR